MICCPRCTGPLQQENSDGVRIDVCQTCKGIWLDTQELQDLLRCVEGGTVGGPPPEITVPETTGEMKCPRCSLGLTPFEYGGDSGIELDRCPKCMGLWLDAGEWESIERKVTVARWRPQSKADKAAENQGWIGTVLAILKDWGRNGKYGRNQ